MGEKTVGISIDPINKGINRFDTDIRRGKIVEGLNVISDDGDLRRRDALASIHTGVPRILTEGSTVLALSEDAEGEEITYATNRIFTSGEGVKRIYIGNEDKFSGLDVGTVDYTAGEGPASTDYGIKLNLYYNTAGGWVLVPWHLDSTKQLDAGDWGYVDYSLCKEGTVAFHLDDISSAWVSNTTSGRNSGTLTTGYYYICIEFSSLRDVQTVAASGVQYHAPGFRCFDLDPVNGIFSTATKDKRSLVVCSDKEVRGYREKGAMIGKISSSKEKTTPLHLIKDEGSGTFDQPITPQWVKGVSTAYGSTLVRGSAGKLKKEKQSLDTDWFFSTSNAETEWRGGPALTATTTMVQHSHGSSTTSVVVVDVDNIQADEFQHYLLRCTAGPAAAQERKIWKNTATAGGNILVYVDPAFTATSTDASSYQVISPHCRLEMTPSKRDYEVSTNDADTITPLNPSAADMPWAPVGETGTAGFLPAGNPIEDEPVHYYIGREARWTIPSGEFWYGAYEPFTGFLYLSNGEFPITRFDGEHLRLLYPTYDTASDPIAEIYANMLGNDDEDISRLADEGVVEKGKLDSRPITGRFIISYLQQMFIAHAKNVGTRLRWSAGYNSNHIWPLKTQATVRDNANKDISGMAALGNSLFIWTNSNIMAANMGNRPEDLLVNTAVTGVGFSSHHGVEQIGQMIVGPNTDGIWAFNGYSAEPILDDWKRLIKGGVNESRLHKTVAVNLYQKGWYLLAVPKAGSKINDRIVVWDYARKQMWLWSAPYGASFLSKKLDDDGREVLLVGTNDGFIQTLADKRLDDASEIESYARTPPMNPFADKEAALTDLQVTSFQRNSSTDQKHKIKVFVSNRDEPTVTADLDLDSGQNKLGTLKLNDATLGALGDDRWKTKRINLDNKTKGHDFQVQVGSTTGFWKLRRIFAGARDMGKRG